MEPFSFGERFLALTKINNHLMGSCLDGTIEAILDMAIRITDSEAGYVMLGTKGNDSLRIISARGDSDYALHEYLQGATQVYFICVLLPGQWF